VTAAINTLADGKIYLGDGTNQAAEVTMSGDVTIDNTGATAIGVNKVLTGNILDGTIVVEDLANDAVETAKIATDAVTTTKVADANITYAKIQNVSATDMVLGRVSSNAGVLEEIATTGSGVVVRANSPVFTSTDITIGTPNGISVGLGGVVRARDLEIQQ
ncbi:MAG: hypothetical protein HQ474_06485, partial [Flammeovirgaceae bacterium]|nr:hypothetical protein [Flammeovirgaceae bacterium]